VISKAKVFKVGGEWGQNLPLLIPYPTLLLPVPILHALCPPSPILKDSMELN